MCVSQKTGGGLPMDTLVAQKRKLPYPKSLQTARREKEFAILLVVGPAPVGRDSSLQKNSTLHNDDAFPVPAPQIRAY
ncbi:hypothetical protein NPIL_699311 [Nephila pilipes]|uniref:Uncharacterized protein n=1 Tax=Nephila pilipes TaxID=299642 RepID=A0A8X6U5R5_NEPPI|nr:hypothetical protein NPIL_699311 [Nephila pilipes]